MRNVIVLVFIFTIAVGGYAFKVVGRISNLPSRYVKDIEVDSKRIYIATANGLAIYNKTSKKIEVYSKKNGLPDNYISDIALDIEDGIVYIATPKGLAIFDINKKKVIGKLTKRDGLSDNDISCVFIERNRVWIGTKYWGINLYYKKEKRLRKKPYTEIDGLGSNKINDIDTDGEYIWAATEGGISYYDPSVDMWFFYDTKNGLASSSINSLKCVGRFVWCATPSGISLFDKYNEKPININVASGKIVDDFVQDIAYDGKYIWIGTFGGVSLYDTQKKKWFAIGDRYGVAEDSLSSIAIDGNYVIFGYDGRGVLIMDKDIPQSELTISTRYIAPEKVGIYATIADRNGISSFDVSYKSIISKWKKSGIILNRLGGKYNYDKEIAIWNIDKNAVNETYEIMLKVRNKKGKQNISFISFVVDTILPQIKVSPIKKAYKKPDIIITGTYSERNLSYIKVVLNGIEQSVRIRRDSMGFSCPISLKEGNNEIKIEISDIAMHKITKEYNTIFDNTPPQISLAKNYNTKFNNAEITIEGEVVEPFLERMIVFQTKEKINYKKISEAKYRFKKNIVLEPGKNEITIVAYDIAGNKSVKKLSPVYASDIPYISIAKGQATESYVADYELRGIWRDKDIDRIVIEPFGVEAKINKNNTFSAKVKLKPGDNPIKVVAYDKAGNSSFAIFSVRYIKAEEKEEVVKQDTEKITKTIIKSDENLKRAYNDLKKKYEDLLKRYKELLKAKSVSGGKYSVESNYRVVYRTRDIYIPKHKRALYFAPFKPDRDSIVKIAKKYLGSKKLVGYIVSLNDNTSPRIIRARKRLLVPTKRMINFMNYGKYNRLTRLIVDITGESYHSTYGRGFSSYLREIRRRFRRQGIKLKRIATGIYKLPNNVLIFIEKGSVFSDKKKRKLKSIYRRTGCNMLVWVNIRGNYIEYNKI